MAESDGQDWAGDVPADRGEKTANRGRKREAGGSRTPSGGAMFPGSRQGFRRVPPIPQERKPHAMTVLLKSGQLETPVYNPPVEPSRPMLGIVPNELAVRGAVSGAEKAVIGKGLILHGDISGSEPLFIDGKIEGSINLPGDRVTVGRSGLVDATINAREIVVMGKVLGNLTATDRIDIRAEGAVTGDVIASRISIEDGAFFKGSIDIRKSEAKPLHSVSAALAENTMLKQA